MASTRWTRAIAARAPRTAGGFVASLLTAFAAALALFLAIGADGVRAQDGVPFPEDEDALTDLDRDGLANLYEYFLGTDPRQADTDSDGFDDGAEVAHRTNPLTPTVDVPDESAIRLDFIPEAGGIRVAVTVHSRGGFDRSTALRILMSHDDTVTTCNREMLELGHVFRQSGSDVAGYLSRRLPLGKMPSRFGLGAYMRDEDEFVIDDVLAGVRGGQFFLTQLTELPDHRWLGSTLFLTVTVETGGEPGFSPDEDCRQVFGRMNGIVKVILDEYCEDAVERYCPENCGADVGLRVVCIRDLFRR